MNLMELERFFLHRDESLFYVGDGGVLEEGGV